VSSKAIIAILSKTRPIARMVLLPVNQANGMLTPTGQVIKTNSPCTIVFARA
jgi:hypothetical protein